MRLNKKQSRLRRARRGRAKIRELENNRLTVHRTPRHIYAQVIAPNGSQVLVAASTVEPEVRKGIKNGGNVEAAAIVGARIAEKAKAAGIDSVAFDRSGFRYHGRVKALADAAREAGLKF
jgi:large subunit ribosomal protein L18